MQHKHNLMCCNVMQCMQVMCVCTFPRMSGNCMSFPCLCVCVRVYVFNVKKKNKPRFKKYFHVTYKHVFVYMITTFTLYWSQSSIISRFLLEAPYVSLVFSHVFKVAKRYVPIASRQTWGVGRCHAADGQEPTRSWKMGGPKWLASAITLW